METYAGLSGDTGVLTYEIGKNSILVEFVDHSLYLYTDDSAGRKQIAEMKALAKSGRGLTTYISTQVKKNYAACLRPSRH